MLKIPIVLTVEYNMKSFKSAFLDLFTPKAPKDNINRCFIMKVMNVSTFAADSRGCSIRINVTLYIYSDHIFLAKLIAKFYFYNLLNEC